MTRIKNQAPIGGKPRNSRRDARPEVAMALPFYVAKDRRITLRINQRSDLYINAKGELDRLDNEPAPTIIATTYGRMF